MKKDNNIKKNMLSLKSMQAELEQLKQNQILNSKPPVASQTVTNEANGKQTLITRFRHSLSPMAILWLVSTVLTYANKIPIISRIVGFLALWYGRSSWWKALVALRRYFIILNAMIGVYTMFSITGFSTDNLLGGFMAMGASYFEMLGSFVRRVFNWLVDLFDHKVVPKPPVNQGWVPWNWGQRGVVGPGNPFGKIQELARTQDFYNPTINVTNKNYYWGIPSWVWYTGLVVISAGLLYVGYKSLDGASIMDYFRSSNKTQTAVVDPASTAQSITVNDARTDAASTSLFRGFFTALGGAASSIGSTAVAVNTAVHSALNPFNWFTTETQAASNKDSFLQAQGDANLRSTNFYPYESNNPHDPWLKKLRISWFGETEAEKTTREAVKRELINKMDPHVVHNGRGATPVAGFSIGPGLITPNPMHQTWPTHEGGPGAVATTVGFGVKTPYNQAAALAHVDHVSAQLTETVIKNAPPAPLGSPEREDWANHIKGKQTIGNQELSEKIRDGTFHAERRAELNKPTGDQLGIDPEGHVSTPIPGPAVTRQGVPEVTPVEVEATKVVEETNKVETQAKSVETTQPKAESPVAQTEASGNKGKEKAVEQTVTEETSKPKKSVVRLRPLVLVNKATVDTQPAQPIPLEEPTPEAPAQEAQALLAPAETEKVATVITQSEDAGSNSEGSGSDRGNSEPASPEQTLVDPTPKAHNMPLPEAPVNKPTTDTQPNPGVTSGNRYRAPKDNEPFGLYKTGEDSPPLRREPPAYLSSPDEPWPPVRSEQPLTDPAKTEEQTPKQDTKSLPATAETEVAQSNPKVIQTPEVTQYETRAIPAEGIKPDPYKLGGTKLTYKQLMAMKHDLPDEVWLAKWILWLKD